MKINAFLRALALSCLLASSISAQTAASLTGFVTVAGEPMPGVTVTIASPSLQGTRSAVTGENGAYRFASLPPGEYRVRFAASGVRERSENARLQLAQTTRVDAAMLLETSEALDVHAAPAELETSAVATTLTLDEIEKLPVQRAVPATVLLMPGVAAGTGGGQLQISGAPSYDFLALVDGAVVNENTRGQMRPMYVEDAIQETTVLTAAISAEYGRFTGGVVSTITRSGGNELSGSIRDSLTNPAWSATTPANETREDSLSHVWETTLGGYILRDRLWFFGAGRWAKNDTARQTVAVPSFGSGPNATPASPQLSYLESNDQKRFEGKLTAQLGERHNLVGSYFGIDTEASNARTGNAIYDAASLMTRNEPEALAALRYDVVASPALLVTARFARRDMSLSSGSELTDLVGGTVLFDRANGNARFNAPSLCAVCGEEERDNRNIALAAQWFIDSSRFGSHHVVAGVDRFDERRTPAGHESGSDFGLFVSRAQYKDGAIYPVITPTTNNGGGTFIRWMPLLADAQPNRLRTDSLYLNDEWNPSARWSLSLGARYDRNDAVDADGSTLSDDARLSPRLAVQFDPFASGRQRFTLSYAEYASRIADSIASANQVAGITGAIDFAYRGPAINANGLTVSLPDAIRMVFDHFLTQQGGTDNRAATNLRPNGSRSIPGFSSYIDGTLASPYVRELTAGYGLQIGQRAFTRIDLIHRDWRDLYAASVTTSTRRATTPLGIPVDLVLNRNSDTLERTYRAVQLQARWSGSRFETGAFYTWSQLRGNHEGETMTGAVADADPSLYYPEFLNYERFAPVGWLRGDQRHRLRAFAGYDVPLPVAAGALYVSVLQTVDSGLPYSAQAAINVTSYNGVPENRGYAAVPNGVYYLSDRGELRTDDAYSTDLAVRYSRRVLGVELFAQGDLLNAFDNDAVVDPQRINTSVVTAATSANFQTFNPFTTTPVAGTHYQLNASFGQPLNEMAYQRPRTVRLGVGARF